jgi:hypothetical protein
MTARPTSLDNAPESLHVISVTSCLSNAIYRYLSNCARLIYGVSISYLTMSIYLLSNRALSIYLCICQRRTLSARMAGHDQRFRRGKFTVISSSIRSQSGILRPGNSTDLCLDHCLSTHGIASGESSRTPDDSSHQCKHPRTDFLQQMGLFVMGDCHYLTNCPGVCVH